MNDSGSESSSDTDGSENPTFTDFTEVIQYIFGDFESRLRTFLQATTELLEFRLFRTMEEGREAIRELLIQRSDNEKFEVVLKEKERGEMEAICNFLFILLKFVSLDCQMREQFFEKIPEGKREIDPRVVAQIAKKLKQQCSNAIVQKLSMDTMKTIVRLTLQSSDTLSSRKRARKTTRRRRRRKRD